MKLNGKRKALLKGGNSSCRFHIRQHFALYKEKCDKADIPVVHWAIPRPIWKAMEEEKAVAERGIMTKKKGQQLLDFASVVGSVRVHEGWDSQSSGKADCNKQSSMC